MSTLCPASSLPEVSCVSLIEVDTRFLLFHDSKNEDAIKNFFYEVYELYVKVRVFNRRKAHVDYNESVLRDEHKDQLANIRG